MGERPVVAEGSISGGGVSDGGGGGSVVGGGGGASVGEGVADGATVTPGVFEGGAGRVAVGEIETAVFVGVSACRVGEGNSPVGVNEGRGEGERVLVGGEHFSWASVTLS